MSTLLGTADITSTATETRIEFATEGGGHWPVWDRFITLDKKKAFHIGNICGTCAFVFKRLDGANDKVSPTELSARFREGLTSLDPDVVRTAIAVLPAGPYAALLVRCAPRLVLPSKDADYFFNEQVGLWGIDSFWGLPHYANCEYYRTETIRVSNGSGLFEFIVPMFPHTYLHAEAVESYRRNAEQGQVPTALALSVLDVKQPADWEGDPEFTEHWCLSHYLLDGHHKVYAASQTGTPLSILTFVALEKGVATREQVHQAIQALPQE